MAACARRMGIAARGRYHSQIASGTIRDPDVNPDGVIVQYDDEVADRRNAALVPVWGCVPVIASHEKWLMSSNGCSPYLSALALYELEQPGQVARGLAPLADDLGCSRHEDSPIGLDKVCSGIKSRKVPWGRAGG